MANVALKIEYDGTVPGIAEKRLSVDAFGPTLNQLLSAVRRIASGLVKDALEEDYGARGGRFADIARRLDIELAGIEEGSLGVVFALVLRVAVGQQIPLFEDLPEKSATAFVDAVRAESSGELTSKVVRKYLASLPAGVTRQAYRLYRDNQELRSIEIGEVTLAEIPEGLPYLAETEGPVVGVGFEPGRPQVRLRSQAPSHFHATNDQVEAALRLRGVEAVRVLAVVSSDGARLLAIANAQEPKVKPTEADRKRLIFDRWDGLLKRLAR